MKQVNVKKLLILNLPYLLFVWLFDKAAQTVRLSPGADLSGKLLNLGSGFSQAMESIAPSFHPADLLVGLIGAVVIRLIIYTKGEKRKEIPQRYGVRFCKMGNCRRYKALHRPRI